MKKNIFLAIIIGAFFLSGAAKAEAQYNSYTDYIINCAMACPGGSCESAGIPNICSPSYASSDLSWPQGNYGFPNTYYSSGSLSCTVFDSDNKPLDPVNSPKSNITDYQCTKTNLCSGNPIGTFPCSPNEMDPINTFTGAIVNASKSCSQAQGTAFVVTVDLAVGNLKTTCCPDVNGQHYLTQTYGSCGPVVPLSVSLTASPTSITLPTNSITLTWTTTDSPESCMASGSWNGNRAFDVSNTQTITGLTAGTYNYTLTCSKSGSADASSTASVTVLPASTDTTTDTGCIGSDCPSSTPIPPVCSGSDCNPGSGSGGSFNLIINKSGMGTISGVSTPPQTNVSCGAGCSSQTKTYSSNTQVVLTETPDTGRVFTGWSGACTGTSTCSILINTDKTVNANFAIDPNYKEF